MGFSLQWAYARQGTDSARQVTCFIKQVPGRWHEVPGRSLAQLVSARLRPDSVQYLRCPAMTVSARQESSH
jgi:hypothetical protein